MQNDNKNYNSDTSSVGTDELADDGPYHEQKPKIPNLVDHRDVKFAEPLQQRRHTNIDMHSIVGSMKAAIKRSIPTAAFFILITEFCERFSYYGMRSVLTLFLKDFLKFNEHQTVEFFHIFVVITYSASVLGAYISDRHLGRYETIQKCGFVFLIGSATLTIGSVPYIGSDNMNYWLSMIGILMIGGGSGAMKPCVAPFGEDQFTERHHPDTKAMYFDMFYLLINVGALISAPLTPKIRETVCYQLNKDQLNDSRYNQCFVGAFGLPGILMASALLIFMFGKNKYTMNPVTKNAIPNFIAALKSGIKNYYKKEDKSTEKLRLKAAETEILKKGEKPKPKTIFGCSDCDENTRVSGEYISKIWTQLLPVPIFWAIFDQAGSLWTLQALEMNGWVKNPFNKKPIFYLLSDQAESINPFCVVIFLVISISWKRYGKKMFMKQEEERSEDETDFEKYVPVGMFTPIKKICYAFLLTSVSIYVAAYAQSKIDLSMTRLPNFQSYHEYGLRVRNVAGESCVVRSDLVDFEDLGFGEDILLSKREDYPDTLTLECPEAEFKEVLKINLSQKSRSTDTAEFLEDNKVPLDVTVFRNKAIVKFMNSHIPKDNEAKINFVNVQSINDVLANEDAESDNENEIVVELGEDFGDYGFEAAKTSLKISAQDRPTVKVHGEAEEVRIQVNEEDVGLSSLAKIKNYEGMVTVDLNGTALSLDIIDGVEYTIVGTDDKKYKVFTDIQAREVSINWQFLMYIIITFAELNMSVTILYFTITQSPIHLKTLGSAIFSVHVAMGNVVVIALAKVANWYGLNRYDSFIVYTFLCLLAMVVFSWTGRGYKYTSQFQIKQLAKKIKIEQDEIARLESLETENAKLNPAISADSPINLIEK